MSSHAAIGNIGLNGAIAPAEKAERPRVQQTGAAMSPPRAKTAEVDDGVSVNWKGATFFIQNTGALGILAAVIFWTGPRLLDLNDKLDKSIERQTIVLDAIAKGQYQMTADIAEIKNRIKGKE